MDEWFWEQLNTFSPPDAPPRTPNSSSFLNSPSHANSASQLANPRSAPTLPHSVARTMKSFFAIAVAAVASLAIVNAVDCDTAKLIPLLSDPDVKKCGADTGLQPPVPPAAAVLAKVCGNAACQAAVGKLKAVGVGDCSIAGVLIETDFLNPIEKYCASSSSSAPSPAPATTAPAPAKSPTPTTAGPTTTGPTTAPSPTTVAPTPATSSAPTSAPPTTSKPSTGSDSGNAIEDNTSPISVAGSGSTGSAVADVKTTAPTPAPASSASSVAFAASAVALAVGAAFV